MKTDDDDDDDGETWCCMPILWSVSGRAAASTGVLLE